MKRDLRVRLQPPALWWALALGACSAPAPVVVQDLVAELPAAEMAGEPSVILFGTPAAEAHQERGVTRASPDEAERFAWADKTALLRLEWAERAARTLVLDVSPVPGMLAQTLDLRLNGKSLGRHRFRSRTRLLVALPTASQRIGENRLSLRFTRDAPSSETGRGHAARLHSLLVAAEGAAGLAALAAAGAPPTVDTVSAQGTQSIVHVSGLELRYALRAPAGAELRVVPALSGASRSGSRLSVSVEDADGGPRELWGRALRAGESATEQRLALPGGRGRLVLRAEGDGSAWAVWGAPRVMAPAREPRQPSAQALALRKAVRGTNVILVVLDAAGAPHFSCYGYSRSTTPQLDAIAAEGVLFERAYTTAVYTLAAMSSLWTSRPPEECSSPRRGLLPPPAGPPTLAQRLAARGVHSAGFVASARAGQAYGFHRGFSEFHEVLTGGIGRAQTLREAVARWLQGGPPAPFFLYVHFREPHFPYDPPAPFAGRFGVPAALPAAIGRDQALIDAVNSGATKLSEGQRDQLVAAYDANLAYADNELGELRRVLEAQGLWERSVLIVTADHGEALGEHGFIGHNKQVHRESAQIPLLIRFPGNGVPRGVRVTELTDLLDLAPTISEIFGLETGKTEPGPPFAGTSLLSLAAGGAGRGFVVTGSATGARPSYALRDGQYTLIRSLRQSRGRLFDAVSDPGERQDLSERLPLEASLARARLFLWLANLRPPPAQDGEVQLTPEQRDQVRALGYVN
jgi:arylsulfatase